MLAKWSRLRFASATAASAMAVPFGRPAFAADQTLLRLSVPAPPTDILGIIANRFAAAVDQQTSGSLHVEVFFNGTLAKQQESVDGLRTGTVDLTIQTTAFLETIAPRVQAIDLPFLFTNRPSAERVLDGDVGRDLDSDLADKGIVVLAWGTAGWRQFELASKPLVHPQDARGLRIRVQNGPVYVSMLRALSALPITIDVAEVYLALSQKAIDGIEVPPATLLSNNFYTTLKYISLTNHLYNAAPLLMSKQRVDALTLQQKTAVQNVSRELLTYWRGYIANFEKENLAALQGKGLIVNDTDHVAFRTAMSPVYDEYRPKVGSAFLDRIIRQAGR